MIPKNLRLLSAGMVHSVQKTVISPDATKLTLCIFIISVCHRFSQCTITPTSGWSVTRKRPVIFTAPISAITVAWKCPARSRWQIQLLTVLWAASVAPNLILMKNPLQLHIPRVFHSSEIWKLPSDFLPASPLRKAGQKRRAKSAQRKILPKYLFHSCLILQLLSSSRQKHRLQRLIINVRSISITMLQSLNMTAT